MPNADEGCLTVDALNSLIGAIGENNDCIVTLWQQGCGGEWYGFNKATNLIVCCNAKTKTRIEKLCQMQNT